MVKKGIVKIVTFLALFLVNLTAFADKWFKIEETNTDSVKLSWEKDEKISFYQVKYWSDKNNLNKETEALEENSIEIKNLASWEKNYFMLIWLDLSWTEIFKSDYLELDWNTENKDVLALKTLELKEENILRVTFSQNLDASRIEESEFKIESIKDISDYLKIKEKLLVEWDPKSLDLVFDWTPTSWEEYKVVVLAVFDEKWNNIEFWIDSEWKFKAWEISKSSEVEKQDLNSAVLEEKVETKKEENKEEKTISGTSTTNENVWKNVESLSKNKENLPQTWPEVILLFIIALLVPAGIFMLKNKNS